MKKVLFTIIISVLCLSGYTQKLHLGLKFSPHFSWLKSDNPTIISNDGIGFGFSYGLMSDYNIRDNYGFNIEFLHSLGKFSTSYKDSSNNNVISKWNQQYVEVPVALKMRTNEISGFTYFGKIGICPKFKTSAKLNNQNNSEQINFINSSLIIGGGIHYSLGGNTAFVGGITFHNGLMRMNKKKEDIFSANSIKEVQLKPSYLSIDLGIMF